VLEKWALVFPKPNSFIGGPPFEGTPPDPQPLPRYGWMARCFPRSLASRGSGTGSHPTWHRQHTFPRDLDWPKVPLPLSKDSHRLALASPPISHIVWRYPCSSLPSCTVPTLWSAAGECSQRWTSTGAKSNVGSRTASDQLQYLF